MSNKSSKSMVGSAQRFFTSIAMPCMAIMLLMGCEDCYECDINRPEPYFNVVLINETLLSSVKNDIKLLDSLLVAKREEERDLPENAPDEEFEALEFTIDSINVEKRDLDNKRRIIQSGSVFIDTLYSSLGKYKTYPDSANSYQFPLSMNQNSSTYYIVLDGKSDTLTVTYNTKTVVENGSVIIRADSIVDTPHIPTSFIDSIHYEYRNDQRLSNETYLYIYF